MHSAGEDEFAYTVETRRAGAGRTIWRWEIRRRGEKVPVISSVSLRSRAAAEEDAINAIRQIRAAAPSNRSAGC